MTKPSLSAVRDLHPNKPSRCSRCQHAEFVHAYAGPCLFHDCECPFFIPEAEPDVEEGRGEGTKTPALTSTFTPAMRTRVRALNASPGGKTERDSVRGAGRYRPPAVAPRPETALHDAGGGTMVLGTSPTSTCPSGPDAAT